MTFVDAAGVALHVRRDAPTVATPGPTLVYLHSLGAELRIWDGVVERLPDHAHLRLDLRGHGLSEVPPGPYTIASMASDVLSVLDRACIGDAVLVGISVGGQIALRAALERPHQVAGVVALDTAGRIGDRDAWDARIAEVRAGGIASIADAVVARWFGPGFAERDAVAPRGYRQMLLRAPAEGYVATCAALRDEDLNPRLGEVTQPVLVLCGAHDAATPPALVRGLAAGLPNARYAEIEGAAHLPCVDQPAAVARQIDAFVRGLTGTAT